MRKMRTRIAITLILAMVITTLAPLTSVNAASIKGPKNLTAKEYNTTSITLKWSKVSGASAYYVYKNKKYIKSSKTKKTSYRVKKLKKNTTYTFRVRAKVNGRYTSYTYTVKARPKRTSTKYKSNVKTFRLNKTYLSATSPISGSKYTYTLAVKDMTPDNVLSMSVVWSSSNTNVAKVYGGKVYIPQTAKVGNTATIYARSCNGIIKSTKVVVTKKLKNTTTQNPTNTTTPSTSTVDTSGIPYRPCDRPEEGKPEYVKSQNVYVNYAGQSGTKTTKIQLGTKWSNIAGSLGSPEFTVNRDYCNIYVYDEKDCDHYLEVYVGNSANPYNMSGRILGWTTNQTEQAVWNGTRIYRGMDISTIPQSINDDNGLGGEKPYFIPYKKYKQTITNSSTGSSAYGEQDGNKLLFSNIFYSEVGYDFATELKQEEHLAENITNAFRKSYGLNVLEHSDGLYSGLGGAKDSAEDWAACPSHVDYKGGHITSGSLKPELKGLDVYDRKNLINSSATTENSNMCGGYGADAWSHMGGLYNSLGHRNSMLFTTRINGTGPTIQHQAVGFASSVPYMASNKELTPLSTCSHWFGW